MAASPRVLRARTLVLLLAAALGASACATADEPSAGDDGSTAVASPYGSRPPVTVRLVAHDSFTLPTELLDDLEARTGITVEVVQGGDAGEVVNKAVLTAGNPEGDVLFGVDNTLLTRALDARVFSRYVALDDSQLEPELADHPAEVTPIDVGDVCVVADDAWFAGHGLAVPKTFDDLIKPAYAGLLVTESAATSSPGLAFLMATIARYGDDGWKAYWTALGDSDVKVVNDWTTAYESDFTSASDAGDRPLVVSYGTDPAASIIFASDPKPTEPTTSVLTDTCYRQVEYAGVLRGAGHEAAARAVVDWLLSPEVQSAIPDSMFVLPARAGVTIPDLFQKWAARPAHPLSLPANDIAENREDWVQEWAELVGA